MAEDPKKILAMSDHDLQFWALSGDVGSYVHELGQTAMNMRCSLRMAEASNGMAVANRDLVASTRSLVRQTRNLVWATLGLVLVTIVGMVRAFYSPVVSELPHARIANPAHMSQVQTGLPPVDPPDTTSDVWQYGLRLGDPRERVHQLLGIATRTTEFLEEYPASGVTAWFDAEGRIGKLNFQGKAASYLSDSGWISSDRPVLFGLTAHTDEDSFRRVLGAPAVETHELAVWDGAALADQLRCVWKRDGYVLDALFWGAERSQRRVITYPRGTLVWFEVQRGL